MVRMLPRAEPILKSRSIPQRLTVLAVRHRLRVAGQQSRREKSLLACLVLRYRLGRRRPRPRHVGPRSGRPPRPHQRCAHRASTGPLLIGSLTFLRTPRSTSCRLARSSCSSFSSTRGKLRMTAWRADSRCETLSCRAASLRATTWLQSKEAVSTTSQACQRALSHNSVRPAALAQNEQWHVQELDGCRVARKVQLLCAYERLKPTTHSEL